MWLLLSIALAADPPPASAPAPAIPRRTCEHAQLCDGRCIPWTETCPAVVKTSLAVMAAEEKQEGLIEQVCGPTLSEPGPPPPTIEEMILVSAAAGIACSASADPRACDAAGRPQETPRVEVPPAPKCRQAPPTPK